MVWTPPPPPPPPPPEEVLDAAAETISDIADEAQDVVEDVVETADSARESGERGGAALQAIAGDPVGFAANVGRAVKEGLTDLGQNAGNHLANGLVAWLTGELAAAGVNPPRSLALKDLVAFVLRTMGVSYDRLRPKLVRIFGPTAIDGGEELWSLVSDIIRGGPAAGWEHVKQRVGAVRNAAAEDQRSERGSEQVYGIVVSQTVLLAGTVHNLFSAWLALSGKQPRARLLRYASQGELQKTIGLALSNARQKSAGGRPQAFAALVEAQQRVNAAAKLSARRVSASQASAAAAIRDLQRLQRALSSLLARYRGSPKSAQAKLLTLTREAEQALARAVLQLQGIVQATADARRELGKPKLLTASRAAAARPLK
ncbi:MAG TPA: hypothetical protein VHP37_28390 [Burkholderiales bacterium]|nr:hypothetical protein [Burkholderiales bacterium]